MTYVMSDIHGQSVAFFDILKQIDFSDDDVLYILGDVIDRGPFAFEVLEYIRSKGNIHMLMGNHEKMMIDFLGFVNDIIDEHTTVIYSRGGKNAYQLWMNNGGGITYDQLLNMGKEKQRVFINYLKNLNMYYKVFVGEQKFLLCHARPIFYEGYSFDENLEILIQDDEILWCRDIFSQDIPDGYVVIHGHSPVQYHWGRNRITKYSRGNIIDIDCGCSAKIKLSCLRLDDMKEYYSDKMV